MILKDQLETTGVSKKSISWWTEEERPIIEGVTEGQIKCESSFTSA